MVVLAILVKYQFTQISALVIFNRYLTDTNGYILKSNIIGKIGYVSVKYRLTLFSILMRLNRFLTDTYWFILTSKIVG